MSEEFTAKLKAIIEMLEPGSRAQGQRDIDAVLQAGANSCDDLLSILQNRDMNTVARAAVCWTLARLGDVRAAPALLEVLRDETSELRSAAAKSLGELGGDMDIGPIVAAMLKDEEREVRLSAAYALGLLGDRSAVEPLTLKLGDQSEDPKVRGFVAEALADLRDPRAVSSLISALADKSAEVRFWAAFALGELGDPRALPELERLAITDNAVLPGRGSVNQEAEAAIQRIQDVGRNR